MATWNIYALLFLSVKDKVTSDLSTCTWQLNVEKKLFKTSQEKIQVLPKVEQIQVRQHKPPKRPYEIGLIKREWLRSFFFLSKNNFLLFQFSNNSSVCSVLLIFYKKSFQFWQYSHWIQKWTLHLDFIFSANILKLHLLSLLWI